MFKRAKNRCSLALLASLLAFAQFVIAAEPCTLAQAPVTPVQHQVMADEQCDAMPMPRASCLVQCFGQDESISTLSSLFSAALASGPAASLDFRLSGTQLAPSLQREAPRGSPDLQVLYCSFQT